MKIHWKKGRKVHCFFITKRYCLCIEFSSLIFISMLPRRNSILFSIPFCFKVQQTKGTNNHLIVNFPFQSFEQQWNWFDYNSFQILTWTGKLINRQHSTWVTWNIVIKNSLFSTWIIFHYASNYQKNIIDVTI